ncbi:hypothetical protein F889_00928 [Acinetobacter colistiniresistens]|uniref:CDI immunity protein domain-containing protein n=1 Tax=Acinetobacter colistiniresistens TaxID=280145 RepID=N9QYU7_9GAMM|nr:hypothetical protein [Acinetobacter colistiniresistens]ENX35261.1 hypothetical protein F889_00928 [Acinetobacter colistiniresistens]
MNKLMGNWLSDNWSVILDKYPKAEPLLYYFSDYFNTVSWVCPFVDVIKNAIRGEGDSIQETSTYLLMNDVVDEGHTVDAAEFYFNGEFDGKVPFKTFALVLEIIALAYVESNPQNREEILSCLPRLKQVYGI